MPRRDWQAAVAELTDVQKLVHLAMRRTKDDEEQVRSELLTTRREAYNDELTAQAAKVGCPGRRGNLGNNASLKALNAASKEDAQSIVNTYNFDLAAAIRNIGQEVRSANRNTYAKRLQDWEGKRADWKQPQITQYAINDARSQAQEDFYKFNNSILGYAVLEPTEAQCPVCQGWIDRGQVPLKVAEQHPPPYHPNCPHVFNTHPEQVAKDECPLLWMGA